MTIGNPMHMRSEANRLRSIADMLGDVSGVIGQRVDAMVPQSYEGPAAERFVHTIIDQRSALARTTGHLQNAAASLDRAADEVEEELRRQAMLRAGALDTATGMGGSACE
jgi:uncharacterized protein YukE